MRLQRSSGILLHPTSLPGPWGVGEFGSEAVLFLDFLQSAGQKLWQVLPLNPTGYGDSPYQCFSAFAGNPLLISLERLALQGWLDCEELSAAPAFPHSHVDYPAAMQFRYSLLRRAAERFLNEAEANAEFTDFCSSQSDWLDDYALFMAAKDAHGGLAWSEWEPALAQRETHAIECWKLHLHDDIAVQRVWQFLFFQHWNALREQAHLRHVRIIGDLPIYVAHDSADVWVGREYFCLDEQGRVSKQAGVPPDYFSSTGQLWGNPTYRWQRLRDENFAWWKRRIRGALKMFDLLRVDHFRGFEAYYEINGGERTAQHGHWIKAPGEELFEALESEFGELPIIAENLGHITPEVERIRRHFGFPGMAILQFAFGTDPQGPSFRPHNYERNTVAYTGGHDNDTTVGWWTSGTGASTRNSEELEDEQCFAREYLRLGTERIEWAMMRALQASVANTVIIPMQDVLGLGSEARMNRPGTISGNWRWRYRRDTLRPEMAARLRHMAELYDRL